MNSVLRLSLAAFGSCSSDHGGWNWFPLCRRWTVSYSRLPAARHRGLRTDTDSFWSSAPAPKVNLGHKAFRPVIIWLLFTQGQKTNERVISASYKKQKKRKRRWCCCSERQRQETGFIWIIINISDLGALLTHTVQGWNENANTFKEEKK